MISKSFLGRKINKSSPNFSFTLSKYSWVYISFVSVKNENGVVAIVPV